MMGAHAEQDAREGFAASREKFAGVLAWLEGNETAGLEHPELESALEVGGRELIRLLLQDHLDLRAHREQPLETVVDAAGVDHGSVEAGHQRALATVFGAVRVERLAHRRPVGRWRWASAWSSR